MSTGFLVLNGSSGATVRSITAASSKISMSNGDGQAGNPSIDVAEANLSLSNIGGTVSNSQLSLTTTTYAPTLTGSTAAGTTTYVSQFGQYTQIGKRIFLDVQIVYSNATGTGNMQVSLPVAAATVTNSTYIGSCKFSNVDTPTYTVIALATATTSPIVAQIASADSVCTFQAYRDATTNTAVAMAAPSTGNGTVTVSINYLVT